MNYVKYSTFGYKLLSTSISGAFAGRLTSRLGGRVQRDPGGPTQGFVDLDLGSYHGWLAATVATYCPIRMVEHPKSKSTQPRFATRWGNLET